MSKYGMSHVFTLSRKQIELATNQLDYVITGDRFKLNFIDRAKRELEKLTNPENQKEEGLEDLFKMVGILNKNGFNVDAKKTSCSEFHVFINQLKDGSKQDN